MKKITASDHKRTISTLKSRADVLFAAARKAGCGASLALVTYWSAVEPRVAAKLATGFELRHHEPAKEDASNSLDDSERRTARFELCISAVTLVPEIRKPFDLAVEGLQKKENRGDRTAIELFLAGIAGWEVGLRRRLDDGKPAG